MTEQPWLELGTALHAHRLEVVRIAGRMAERAREQAVASAADEPPDDATVARWAADTAADARALATQVESLTRRADSLLDDTAIMSLDDLVEPE